MNYAVSISHQKTYLDFAVSRPLVTPPSPSGGLGVAISPRRSPKGVAVTAALALSAFTGTVTNPDVDHRVTAPYIGSTNMVELYSNPVGPARQTFRSSGPARHTGDARFPWRSRFERR